MSYASLEACLLDLERNGQLIRVREEVDPNLEMAAIHLRVYAAGGPALLFEQVKGSKFRACSNLFGTLDRSRFIFRDTLSRVQSLIELKNDPVKALKQPFNQLGNLWAASKSIPLKNPLNKPVLFERIALNQLPQIKHWPMDGGAFVTLPQVYSEDPDLPGIMKANLGMYRVQLSGNEFTPDAEIGLHYQLHRGIGVHHTRARRKQQPLKVSVFVGGPPAHTVSAVMPLPEGISEMTFAGVLANRRFRYCYDAAGHCISTDADFVITGEIMPGETKPEGPFGDHLGYYSLTHLFPVMRVHEVYARKNAIWPFTVVGRPPQEDTSFGALIHEMTGSALKVEIPGLKEVHAVDAAGVHPLLLAIGSERYTPYLPEKRPAELLTIAHHILGTGQLSLAKFLLIAGDDSGRLNTHDIAGFFSYMLERVNWMRDLHFHTETTIDTLDYSGTGINNGSKVVIAANGETVRKLANEIPEGFAHAPGVRDVKQVMPGVLALQMNSFVNYETAAQELESLDDFLQTLDTEGIALLVLADQAAFVAASLNNFLWVTFTRTNPSHDMYGVGSVTRFKHWGCRGPLILDARIKPHHAPELIADPAVEKAVDRIFARSGSLGSLNL